MRMAWICAPVVALFSAMTAAQPIVIAHRGASGYLPEHTLEAYAMAYAMGADYVEPDLVLTKDSVFVCMHDIHLELTTDVEQKFPDRKASDGHWYPADFTLAEVKTLCVHERLKNRFPQEVTAFEVPTFEEMIQLVQGLNKTSGRQVGIYPELKAPAWHAQHGLPMEQAALDVLTKYGYTAPDAKVYLQCFEFEPLKKLRELGTKLPLVLLIAGGREAEQYLSDAGLDEVAKIANGIGPDRKLIETDPALVERAHARKLKVHPYTFRTDDYNRSKYGSFSGEVQHFIDVYKIDGFFTDHPDRGVDAVNRVKQPTEREKFGKGLG